MEEKKVLLSVKDLEVEFRVRGRILTAIRGISLDIYENESIAIVGESAAGKSVFTKTFAGMLDDNGYVSNGSIVFNDPELAETTVPNTPEVKARIKSIHAKLNAHPAMKTVPQSTAASMSLSKTGSAGPPSARQRLTARYPH